MLQGYNEYKNKESGQLYFSINHPVWVSLYAQNFCKQYYNCFKVFIF